MNNDDRRDEAAMEWSKNNHDRSAHASFVAGVGWCRETEVAPLQRRVEELSVLLTKSVQLHKDLHSSACAKSEDDCFCGEQEWVGDARAALAETQPGGEE